MFANLTLRSDTTTQIRGCHLRKSVQMTYITASHLTPLPLPPLNPIYKPYFLWNVLEVDLALRNAFGHRSPLAQDAGATHANS